MSFAETILTVLVSLLTSMFKGLFNHAYSLSEIDSITSILVNLGQLIFWWFVGIKIIMSFFKKINIWQFFTNLFTGLGQHFVSIEEEILKKIQFLLMLNTYKKNLKRGLSTIE